eukprot:271371_1
MTTMNRLRHIVAHIEPNNASSLNNKQCMKQYTNKSVVLNSYPSGVPLPENFRIKQQSINTLNNGDILVEIQCISIDAYLRTKMFKESQLHAAVPLGGKMTSLAYGKIIESRNNKYKVGEYISGGFPVEKYTVVTKKQLKANMFQKIVSPSGNPNDLRYYLTYLGLATGCSAYAGAYYVTKDIKQGDIAVVNAASGAVGSIVCQLYRNKGAKVIAITGGLNKKKYLLETLGLYKCIDYKTENIDTKLSEYAPKGFDIAFDNVGGEQLDILLNHLNEDAQIVLCGAVSQYNTMEDGDMYGPKKYLELAVKNAQMKGFTMFKYYDKLREIRSDLLRMVKNGTLVIKEVPIYGLNNFSSAMAKLLTGDKNGKILLYPL